MYIWTVSGKVGKKSWWFYILRHIPGPTGRKINYYIYVSLSIHDNISHFPSNETEQKVPKYRWVTRVGFALTSLCYSPLHLHNIVDEKETQTTPLQSVSQIWNWSWKYRRGCIILVWNPRLGGCCEGNPKGFISGPRSACGLTALLCCSVVLVLHVLVHGFGVTFDPHPHTQKYTAPVKKNENG